ncbi:uncharacterized protein N7503_008702 [Penicillium pulvis]|uniref:uncharacterized protein n=1 Tax=Penicillium pulvis TaxID=1562058 RepID=UPI0025478162|nr:uncharacterized protein N7503_008702 [Penicillium pulvis]KAJ5792724.1 hypothetical protein N7503_008702 [Penicillium pulvis]
MRETLFKEFALVGLPRPPEALVSISRVEPEGEEELSFTRDGWQYDEADRTREMSWLHRVCVQITIALHRDWGTWVGEIAYGLHLSLRQALDYVDTEVVVLPTVIRQNPPQKAYWHVRGTRRVGVSKADVQMVCCGVREASRFCGLELDRIPSVDVVDSEFGPNWSPNM